MERFDDSVDVLARPSYLLFYEFRPAGEFFEVGLGFFDSGESFEVFEGGGFVFFEGSFILGVGGRVDFGELVIHVRKRTATL